MSPAEPYTWKLVGSRAQSEDWSQTGNGFEPVSAGPFADLDALRVRTAAGEGCAVCRAWLPHAFTYCPGCGVKLGEPHAVRSDLWHSPAGGMDGLPEVPVRIANVSAGAPEDFSLPPGGPFRFAVGGTPRRLVAIDYEQGGLHVWSDTGKKWRTAGLYHPPSLPNWAWSANASDFGICFPGRSIPRWIDPNAPLLGGEDAEGVTVLAGSALRAEVAWMPALAQGSLVVHGSQPGSSLHEKLLVKDAVMDGVGLGLGAPAVSARGDHFWAGERGFIGMPAASPVPAARWTPWGDGFVALPWFRPVRALNGALWQLGRLSGRDYAYERLSCQIGLHDRRAADGPSFSAGSASFRRGERRREPWDTSRSDVYKIAEGDSFLVPLLAVKESQVVVARVTGRARMPEFSSGLEAGLEASIYLSETFGNFRLLWRGTKLRSPRDAVPFIFGGHFYLYLAISNRCIRWSCGVER